MSGSFQTAPQSGPAHRRGAPDQTASGTRSWLTRPRPLRDQQVLLSATGEHANTLKIRPPLTFSEAHADLLVETLDTLSTL
jgi:4-aminobutyrate aminotransferase-like enzyme